MRLTRPLAILTAALALGGCVTGQAPATSYYLLNPLARDAAPLGQSTDRSAAPLSVEVTEIRLPQYLERPQIVVRREANRLELAEYHQWGGNLRKNMTRVLAKNLSQLLATPDVAIIPHRAPRPADVRVEVEVMQFERGADGQVHLSAQWRLLRGDGLEPLLTRFSDLERLAGEGEGYDAVVAAMSALCGELSREIATAILQR